MQHFVSVIVTVFNGGSFIAAALDSVFRQTYSNFEVIVINDGSTDSTRAVLDGMDTQNHSLRIVHQENSGPAAALNEGMRLAKGDLIALLDGDDVMHPDKLRRHVDAFAADPTIDLTFCWSDWIDPQGQPMGLGSLRVEGVFSFEDLLQDFVIGNTSSVMFRAECLNRAGCCNPQFFLYYDFDLFLRIAHLRPNNVKAIPAALTYYRRHVNQISRDRIGMEREWHLLVEKLASLESVSEAVVNRGRSNMARYFAYLAYEDGAYREAAQRLRDSHAKWPKQFWTDRRNLMLAAAVLSANVLPRKVHRLLERLVGIHTSASVE